MLIVRINQIDITGHNDNIINSNIEAREIVNTNEMNIKVHEKSEIFANLPWFIEAIKMCRSSCKYYQRRSGSKRH